MLYLVLIVASIIVIIGVNMYLISIKETIKIPSPTQLDIWFRYLPEEYKEILLGVYREEFSADDHYLDFNTYCWDYWKGFMLSVKIHKYIKLVASHPKYVYDIKTLNINIPKNNVTNK